MTTHNSRDLFAKSFNTISKQTYSNKEVVIIDSASTDGTLEEINKKANDSDFSVKWISEPDHGIYDALNKGIRIAEGDIIGIMNDQFTSPQALSLMNDAIETTDIYTGRKYDGVHADLIYTVGNKCVRYWHMGDGNWDNSNRIYRNLRKGWMPAHPTMYLRRSVYEKYGLYDTSYQTSADYEFILRILNKDGEIPVRLAYIPQVLVNMFYGGTSNNGVKGYWKNTIEAYRALSSQDVHPAWGVIVSRILITLNQYVKAKNYNRDASTLT